MPRIRFLALMALALSAAWAAPAAAATDTEADIRSRLQRTEKALSETQKRREQFDQAAAAAAKEIEKLRVSVTAVASAAQDREEELSALESTLAALDAEIGDRTADRGRRRGELSGLLGVLARLGRQPPELLIAMPMGPLDAVRSADILADMLPRIEAKAAALRRHVADLGQLREQTARQRSEIAVVAAALSRDRQHLDDLVARKTALQRQNETAGRVQASRQAELAVAAGDLRELLTRLEAEREARRIAAPAGRMALEEGISAPRLDFEKARGRLLLPARGRIISQFGQTNEFGQSAKGLTIETRADAQVVAPYDGIVVFAGLFRQYGEILILEHGDGYHSLIAGLARVDSVPGQWVAAGEPIGVMGRPDGGVPSLYVELRRREQPINPLPWIAARNEKAK